MFKKIRNKIWKAALGVVLCIPMTTIVVYAATMANSWHTYDANVRLSPCSYVGRSYTLSFNGNKPSATSNTVVNTPGTQTGNLTFKEWSVVASNNSGNYAANVDLGAKNFESVQSATAVATAQWNNASLWFGDPSLTGYTFQGWYTAASGGTRVYSPVTVTPATTAYNSTLYAHWKPIGYTVQYSGNNTSTNIYGDVCTSVYTGTTNPTSCTYDVTSYVSSNGYSKTGYMFKHWNTKSDNTGTVYKPGDSIINWTATDGAVITLYAIWEPVTYNVNVHDNKPSDSTGNIVNVK